MQNRIKKKIPLLNEEGYLVEEGWASKPLWEYNKDFIAAPKWRIKEWDYYAIISEKNKFGLAFTISDLGYIGFISIAFFDFRNKFYNQADQLLLFPMGKIGLPYSSETGEVSFKGKKLSVKFKTLKSENKIKRYISFNAEKIINFNNEKGIKGEITLENNMNEDSIVIATSWKENRKAFYYNQKVNCLKAKGQFKIGNDVYEFAPESDLGVLDWGRGVWTYKNEWYWSSLSTYVEGIPFGWNLGYGFSDRTKASENALFYNGKIHKLDLVEFKIEHTNYMKPWDINDNEGKLKITFTPLFDRNSNLNFKIIKSIQHQVFGYFNGFAILENNKKIEINNKLGFAEYVINHW